MHSSAILLDSEGKTPKQKLQQNKTSSKQTNKATPPSPLETAGRKPDTKVLRSDIMSVLRAQSGEKSV